MLPDPCTLVRAALTLTALVFGATGGNAVLLVAHAVARRANR